MAEPLHPKPDHSRSNSKPRRLRQAAAVALGLTLSLIAAEAICRLYARELEEQWQELLAQPGHYYVPSDNPTLVYQLRPEYLFRWMGRQLQINRYGIRDWNDDLAEGKRRVGLLGDSALFGIWQTQFATITDRTQELLDPEQQRLKVFNLGVPGYGIAELAEQFRVKDRIYAFDDVVYLLNLNDFCRRDSVYEGADNSLYRIYRRPRWWSRYFGRKAIYRLRKHGSLIDSNETSDGWYRWLFEGNREFARRHLKAIVDHTRRKGRELYTRVAKTAMKEPCQYCDSPGGRKTYENQVSLPLNGKVQCIDYCIHQIVAALNAGGVFTFASCCGHGLAPGRIDLMDGRLLTITEDGSVTSERPFRVTSVNEAPIVED